MPDVALALAALAMGVAGTPHCALMCGAPCAAVVAAGPGRPGTRRDTWRAWSAWFAGRWLGYTAAGALVAGSLGWLQAAREAAPLLRGLWLLLHGVAAGVGLWMLVRGAMPAWPAWHSGLPVVPVLRLAGSGPQRSGPRAVALRAGAAGLAWAAWPCGLLQSALLLAALASGAAGGALVMAAFATTSGVAVLAAPLLLRAAAGLRQAAAIRAAGAVLVLSAGFALLRGMWEVVGPWCAG